MRDSLRRETVDRILGVFTHTSSKSALGVVEPFSKEIKSSRYLVSYMAVTGYFWDTSGTVTLVHNSFST